MTALLIQGASGIDGEKLTYASINENNKEMILFKGMVKTIQLMEAMTFI